MLKIVSVEPGSIGDQLELCCGDTLLAMNGEDVHDQIDYELLQEREELLLDVEKQDGSQWELEFEKDQEESLGLHFSPPQPRQCHNNCQFCFVRQLPQGLRKSLYVRDDDYRYSYLYGAYISLTNLSEKDVSRILRLKLSPLYVSVHATDPDVRSTLLGREVDSPISLLKRLIAGGIQLHTQIVLCPGQNDGEILDRTMNDLGALYPGVLTLAVVPVGLTGHRRTLPVLQRFTAEQCRGVIEQISIAQQHFMTTQNCRFVFAADELYLQGGVPFPELEAYENLEQVENGVGLVALFRHEEEQILAEDADYQGCAVGVVTGQSAAGELTRFVERFNLQTGSRLEVFVVENHFFSGGVTVAGLLTGTDIVDQLKSKKLPAILLIPDIMCREGQEVFLDDMTLDALAVALNVELAKIPPSPWGIADFIADYHHATM
nr:DUF512 domain-containing protein [uncultured Desulfuromonas sp.]